MIFSRIAYKWLVAAAFVAGMFMDVMDTTIVNVALPTLGQSFGVGDGTFQWVVSGYLLSLAIWIPASGWIGDRFGTKKTFLFALIVFTTGSALCGAAWSIQLLIAFRLLQGVGGGMLTPVGTSMLFRAFPPKERAHASAVLTVPTAIAPALGPVLGGWLVDHASWRWIFFVNVPVGIAAFVFALLFLREHTEPAAGRFDLRGFVCSGGGLALVLYALAEAPSYGWTSPRVLISGIGGIVLFALLVVIELGRSDPLLHLRLFQDRMFRNGTLAMFTAFGVLFGVLFLLPLFLQQLRGLSAFDAGLTTFPQAVGMVLMVQVTSRLYPHVGPRRMLAIGLAGLCLTSALFLLVGLDTNLWFIRGIMFLRGVSMSFALVASQTATFARVKLEETGRASALFNTNRQVAASVGVAVLTTVLTEAAGGGSGASAQVQVQAFHAAFAASILFGVLGIVFALRIRDADAGSSIQPGPNVTTINQRTALLTRWLAVTSTIAQALDLQGDLRRPLHAVLAERFGDRQLLLLIDNFEHVVSASPLVAELLHASPRLTIVVTSRTLLRLSGEFVFEVAPFQVPAAERSSTAQLMANEAVQLFVDRAQASSPAFGLTRDNGAAIAAICRRLDGLPLAIELAAARMRLLSPQALLGHLDRSLQFLTGGGRDLPERQQTLRATIQWSHALLPAEEQRLFRRLGVFVGGCNLDATDAVCNAGRDLSSDVFDGVSSLVDKSLIEAAESEDDELRVRMLETIREFASDLLDAGGEATDVRREHAAYYLAFANSAVSKLRGVEEAGPFGRLERELGNLRAALVWASAAPERLEHGLRLASALTPFWEERGYWAEGRSWLERLLQHARDVSPLDRARALTSAGNLAFFQGDQTAARQHLGGGLTLWREQAPGAGLAKCLRFLARVALSEGDLPVARALCEEGLAIATQLELRTEVGLAQGVLGAIRRQQGDLLDARIQFERGLAAFRELGDVPGAALLLWQLGSLSEAQDDVRAAEAQFQEGLELRGCKEIISGFWLTSSGRGLQGVG